jgi:hypothetical protein
MRFGTWNVRSLYMSGSLARATCEYRKLRLENREGRALVTPRCREEEKFILIVFLTISRSLPG